MKGSRNSFSYYRDDAGACCGLCAYCFYAGLMGVLFREFTYACRGGDYFRFYRADLNPMMCARLLKSRQSENRYATWQENKMRTLQSGYQRC